MNNQAVQLSPKELENLFPFYLLIRQDGVLESFGKSMAKILPDLIPEDFFFNNWLILRPKPEEKNPYQNLDQITKKLIVLSHKSKPDLSFKGQFERLDQNGCYLFIGSPWFNNTGQLLEHGLNINDFALFDSTTDLLHVLRNNEIANNELKEVVSKINQQRLTLTQSNKQLKLFQNLIDNSSDAIQVSEEDGKLYYINNEASKRLGIPQQLANEYAVSDFEQIFKDRTLWLEHVETLKDTEFVTIEGRNVNQTTQKEFPVEVTVKYLNIEGKGYVLANSRDVTVRKKTEHQLKIQEEKYRNIIANMNLGLLEVDMEDRIQYCNHSFSELSGYALEEIVGQKAAEMFLGEENRKQIKVKNELRQTGLSDSFEMIVRNKRGEARWWLISGAPNYNDQGDIIGSIGIHLDITEQKRLERDLELALLASKEASEAKEAFLANMSHEIRTPLNGIIGMIRALNKEPLDFRQKSYLDSANKASQHLLSIINNILDISKIEAGELQLAYYHFNIREVLADVVKILQMQAHDKHIRFEANMDENVAQALVGDATRIRQILINLASNALKFTEDGYVLIRCTANNINKYYQELIFDIEDSGIGMDTKFKEQIFTKFQQEDKSISRKYGGTGLGLVITKELIDLMNGHIEVQSKKGKGTLITIRVTLPIGDVSKIETAETIKIEENYLNRSILIVEDNPMNRLVASHALAPYHFNITEVENGLQAIESLKKQAFDIILMDLQMPLMGGLEATRIIRTSLNINTPIIALTANAFKSEIEKCLEAGMNDYLIKPFEEIALIQAVHKLLPKVPVLNPAKTEITSKLVSEGMQLYDLSKLKAISRGNDQFVQKMILLFIEMATKGITDLQHACKNGDIQSIRKIAHKLKPSINNLGIRQIQTEIITLEAFPDTHDPSTQQLEQLVHIVTNEITQVILALEQNEINPS